MLEFALLNNSVANTAPTSNQEANLKDHHKEAVDDGTDVTEQLPTT